MTEYCDKCGAKKKRESRSNKQNRLYFGVWLKEISEYTGDEVDYLHKFFKGEFLEFIKEGFEPKKIMGKWIIPELTTTDLDTKQFSDYLNRIERFTNITIGITLSQPRDLYYESLGYTKERKQ